MKQPSFIAVVFCLFLGSTLWGQTSNQPGIGLRPLHYNPALKQAQKGVYLSDRIVPIRNQVERRDFGDTLDLPFFDDFTSTELYPDMRLWTDSLVYVNSDFPQSPPSFGVATFDNLDKWGNPHFGNNFSMDLFGASDTLTSRPINLKEYEVGGQSQDYVLSDSIYLSFFWQARGLGDRPEPRDSFVLQFRRNNGLWQNVWSVVSMAPGPFKQEMVPLLSSDFLWEAFQFRFINYTYGMGNLNHVHLDYVRMNRNRTQTDTLIRDVAINQKPPSLLKRYYAMPYDHFTEDFANQKAVDHFVGVRNNDRDIINTRFEFESIHQGNTLALFPFSGSSRNIFRHSDTSESFAMFDFENLSDTGLVTLHNHYRIDPQAGNNTPSLYNALGNNDEYIKRQDFKNYYAYDDGGAEGGIGLEYNGLPPGRSLFALEFEITKPDTLIGISIFFNQSLENVSSRNFNLCIWDQVREGQPEVKPLYEMQQLVPNYPDSLLGFHYYMLDTLLVLPKGTYYIGWSQIADFMLNVGYDNNYRHSETPDNNPYIYYNMLGVWSQTQAISGTPMIRPVVGRDLRYGTNVPTQPNIVSWDVKIWPNPGSQNVYVSIQEPLQGKAHIRIKNIQGVSLLSQDYSQTLEPISVEHLAPGVYFIEIECEGKRIVKKWIKQS